MARGKGKRGVVARFLAGEELEQIAYPPAGICLGRRAVEAILRRALKKALQPRPCRNPACLSVSFGRALRRKAKHD